jgi:hypothetical protein
MSKKLEKLKEINGMLDIVLMELETRIFIESVSEIKEKLTDNKNPRIMTNIKQ